MRVKYSPCHTTNDTIIELSEENTLCIDGEDYEFDIASVTWPKINEQTQGVILESHRENGELFVTVRRFYSKDCESWDTGEYHDISW